MRVDLVLLGEGYVKEDLGSRGRWSVDAARFTKNFFEKSPFKELRALFNVHLVEVASLDRGVDDSPQRDTKRTAFDACHGSRGIERLLVFSHARPPRGVLMKQVKGFLKKHEGTRSAKKARRLLLPD